MTALLQDRNTSQYGTPDSVQPLLLSFPVAATTKIYGGSLVATNSAGDAVPASASSALKLWGRCEHQADNSSGNAGDINVTVKPGVFFFANAGDIVQSSVGKYCYAKDDQTVSLDDSAGTRPVAGIVYNVDSSLGVAVGVGFTSPYVLNPELSGSSTAFYARGAGPSSNVSDLTAFTVASNDGITYAAGDVVLLYAQTSTFANGPYVVGAVASGTAPLTRPDWWAAGATIQAGAVIKLGGQGTLFKNTEWKSMPAAATVVVGSADPALFPGMVSQQTTLASGLSSITNVPVFSATKTIVVIDYISTGNASTVMYQTSSIVASTTGGGTVEVDAKSAPAVKNASDNAVVNVGIINW